MGSIYVAYVFMIVFLIFVILKQFVITNNCKKTKQINKQCFTCTKSVEPKHFHPKKHIMYNGSRESLCRDCSQLGLCLPVRDKSCIKFQDCSICKKLVRYEAKFCNVCQHLVHPYCNGIGKHELENLSKIVEEWYCLTCNI